MKERKPELKIRDKDSLARVSGNGEVVDRLLSTRKKAVDLDLSLIGANLANELYSSSVELDRLCKFPIPEAILAIRLSFL